MADGKVYRTRTIEDQVSEPVFRKDLIDGIIGLPWAPTGVILEDTPTQVPKAPYDGRPDGEVDAGKYVPRAFRILREHLEKHGFSKNCPRCRLMKNSAPGKCPPSTHSVECRLRVEKAIIAMDPTGTGRRIKQSEERTTEHLAGEVEKGSSQMYPQRGRRWFRLSGRLAKTLSRSVLRILWRLIQRGEEPQRFQIARNMRRRQR